MRWAGLSASVQCLKTRSPRSVTPLNSSSRGASLTSRSALRSRPAVVSHRIDPDPAPSLVGAFLDRAQVAIDRRNQLVHSSFPAQASGQIWGHRAAREKSVTDGSTDTVVSVEEMRAFIRELATLVRDFNHVYAWSASTSAP